MIWLLCLLLCAGCQRHDQWQYCHINQKGASSARLLHRSKNPSSGIDLVMIRSHAGLATYLQVHGEPLVAEGGRAKVTLHMDDKVITFFGRLREGGQRVRLTDSLQTALISSLEEGNPVTLQLQDYRETIHPKNFEKLARISHQDVRKAKSHLRQPRHFISDLSEF